jgi:asparagine N-glycosylation enzyme membrane subunit Stt3
MAVDTAIPQPPATGRPGPARTVKARSSGWLLLAPALIALVILFVVPSIFAIGAMLLYAFILPDQHLTTRPPRMGIGEWITTFWLNPRKYPDFALAWWSRFLITLATFMFTTFRLFFLQDELGLSEDDAPAAVTIGVLVYTVALVASGWIAGKISDRTGRRKFLVAGSPQISTVKRSGNSWRRVKVERYV